MRKIWSITALTLGIAIGLGSIADGQVVNPSFETWVQDTGTFGFPPLIPEDTFAFTTPVGWTTSNEITNAAPLGGSEFVTSDGLLAAHGALSAKLTSGLLQVPVVGVLPFTAFMAAGEFDFDLGALLAGLDISAIPGAGVPINTRIKSLSGFYRYLPILSDTFSITSTLFKGNVEVAVAELTSSQLQLTFQSFEADYVYLTCDTPDKAIIMMNSSNLGGIAIPGTTLWVDSVGLFDDGLPRNTLPMIVDDAAFDSIKPIIIPVLDNDSDCDGTVSVGSIAQDPANGSVTINPDGTIGYTADPGFAGVDTFYYEGCDGQGLCDVGMVVVQVAFGVGIESAAAVAGLSLYPIPTSGIVTVDRIDPALVSAELCDLTGRTLLVVELEAQTTLDVSDLESGRYYLRVFDQEGRFSGVKPLVLVK